MSTQTISRVLNNRPDVAVETRDNVRAVIERLGYQPSALARSLIRQRSQTLGVVTAGLNYTGPSLTLNGITIRAEAMGYSLLLRELPEFDDSLDEVTLKALLARQVDGIIWAVSEVGGNRAWIKHRLAKVPVPIIFLTMQPQPDLTVVSFDNYLGGQLAVQHLLDQGYRQIGHIAGPPAWWESRQRKAGWQDTLARAGLPVQPHQWVEGDWSAASGEWAMQRLLEQVPAVEAVFSANDQMALGALHVLWRRGIHVPREIGLVGFDNIAESVYFCPPLTTVQNELRTLGDVAVKQLVAMIESGRDGQSKHEPRTTLLAPQLIVRESSTAR